MKKSLPIIIVIVVVAVGGLWFLTKGKGGVSVPVPGQITKEAGESGEAFTGKIKEAITRGVPLKCSMTMENFSSTSWVKGKNVYAEVKQAGKDAFMIMKENCMWSWEGGGNQGVKMCFEEDLWEAEDFEGQEGLANLPTDVEYRCSPAVFGDAKFDLPAGVNFLEMNEMMEGMMGGEE